MILKNDLDPRKLVVNCIPFMGQQSSLKIVSELLYCVILFNNKGFKSITIENSNQLSNDEIYKWLKNYSSHVIFNRQETDGKLNNKVIAYVTSQVIPSGAFKTFNSKYFNVLNWKKYTPTQLFCVCRNCLMQMCVIWTLLCPRCCACNTYNLSYFILNKDCTWIPLPQEIF